MPLRSGQLTGGVSPKLAGYGIAAVRGDNDYCGIRTGYGIDIAVLTIRF